MLHTRSRLLVSAASLAALQALAAAQGGTERLSVDTLGFEGDGHSQFASVSADGRYTVFQSAATDLVAGDTNARTDVFLRDRMTGATTRVSVSSAGAQGNHHSTLPRISNDGRYVAFLSQASNLVGSDLNNVKDVFVRDLLTSTTSLVSVSTAGVQADAASIDCDLSADGRYVAFGCNGSSLVPGDTGQTDVFVRDRLLGTTERLSVGPLGEQADHHSYSPSISADGRYVAFKSLASNLVAGDTNSSWDVFVRDRQTNTTTRVSVTSAGLQAASDSEMPSLSDDGRFVAFQSRSSFFAGDTNFVIDVYLHDRQTAETSCVSLTPAGVAGSNQSLSPSISGDGRYVAFRSWSSDLVPGDLFGWIDVFVRDTWTASTVRASVDSAGVQGNGHSDAPAITPDGRFVAFDSTATNLAAGDTNGKSDVFLRTMPKAPLPDVKANGVDGALALALGSPLTVTIALDAGDSLGSLSEWWVRAVTPFGTYWLKPNLVWLPSALPLPLLQVPMLSFPGVPVLSGAVLPAGTYEVAFFVDAGIDGVLDGTWSDAVTVTVQ